MQNIALKVLMIDDNVADLVLLEQQLNAVDGFDIELLSQSNADHLINDIEIQGIHIVLIDHHLAGSTGVKVIARHAAQQSSIGFILLTGSDDEQVIADAFRAGAVDFWHKDQITPDQIRRSLQRCIARSTRSRLADDVFERSSDAIICCDTQGFITRFNPAAEALYGMPKEAVLGQSFIKLMREDRRESLGRELLDRFDAGEKLDAIRTPTKGVALHADGHSIDVEYTFSEHSIMGQSYYVLLLRDIGERKRNEHLLEQQAGILSSTSDTVIFFNPTGAIQYVNPAGRKLLEFEDEDSIRRYSLQDLLDYESPKSVPGDFLNYLLHFRDPTERFQMRSLRYGRSYPVSLSLSTITDSGEKIEGYTAVLRDMTAEIEREKQLHVMASQDSLTGLPNRIAFIGDLQRVLHDAMSQRYRVAMLIIDIDNFKAVNDKYGHDTGDKVLRECAARMRQFHGDDCRIARLGGDEFGLTAIDCGSNAALSALARDVLEALSRPIDLLDNSLYVTVSIGMSVFPDSAGSHSELMRQADFAVHAVKSSGRNNFAVFSEDLAFNARRAETIQNNIQKGLVNDEMSLVFQPIYDGFHRIQGAEALLRWQHGSEQYKPSEIIPVAERCGLIFELGAWIFQTGLSRLSEWRQQCDFRGFLSINTSIRQLRDTVLAEQIAQLLIHHDVPASQLRIEIQELPYNFERLNRLPGITLLQDIGVGIGIDDFGTGSTPVQDVGALPVSFLKIDESLIVNVPEDKAACDTVDAMIELARRMDRQTVMEGIETEEQARWLDNFPDVLRQGYYYHKPTTAAELTLMLRSNTRNGTLH